MQNSEIRFSVQLDEQRIPEAIQWEATESGMDGKRSCKATMITIWDSENNTSMRLDLWTKDMLVDDMKRCFYENLVTMADTYQRATDDAAMAQEMKKFAEHFGKQTQAPGQ